MWKSSRLGWIKWALAASALCAYAACQEDDTRPLAVGDCGDECLDGPSPILNPGIGTTGTGTGAGGSGGGGSGGSAGSSSMGATLSGSIQALAADLTSEPSLNGTVKVQASGVELDQVTVTSEANGDFHLAGVRDTLPVWVGVGPFSADPGSPFVDTLQAIDTPLNLPVQLLVMRRTALDAILPAFTLNETEFDNTRGHVILRFLNEQRQGISGVSLISPDPMTTSVAYDAGGTYSDQAMDTELRGAMILLNLPSVPYPGATVTFGVEVAGEPRTVAARIATGAITLVTTVIPQ